MSKVLTKEQLFNPSGLKRSAPHKMTTKERNAKRKATKRIEAERAERAQYEATEAMKHETHLKGCIMSDLEKLYTKRFTRAAGNTTYVLEQFALFNTMR